MALASMSRRGGEVPCRHPHRRRRGVDVRWRALAGAAIAGARLHGSPPSEGLEGSTVTHGVYGGVEAGPVESARPRGNHVGRRPGMIVHRAIVGIEGPGILVHGAPGRQQPGRYLGRAPVGGGGGGSSGAPGLFLAGAARLFFAGGSLAFPRRCGPTAI